MPESVKNSTNRLARRLNALQEGALQGSTMGFADEIEAAIGTTLARALYPELFEDQSITDSYREARSHARSRRKELEDDPLYLAGELGAGIAIPIGAGGNTIRGLATSGALFGGAYGLGDSEADLTEGEYGQAAEDVAASAALNAALTPAIAKGGEKAIKGAGKLLSRRKAQPAYAVGGSVKKGLGLLYSRLLKEINSGKMKTGDAQQWSGYLTNKGFKGEEIDPLLKELKGKEGRLTADQVAELAAKYDVPLKEVRLGDTEFGRSSAIHGSNYSLPYGKKYEELIITSPKADEYKGIPANHFGDYPDQIAWLRSHMRDLEGYNDPAFHLEEIQSHRHQMADRKRITSSGEHLRRGYREPNQKIPKTTNFSDWAAKRGLTKEQSDNLWLDYSRKNPLWNEWKDFTDKELNESVKFQLAVPDAPFKNDAWKPLMIRRALIDAAEKDAPALSWSPGYIQRKRGNLDEASSVVQTYDRDVPKILRREIERLGLKPELGIKQTQQSNHPSIKDYFDSLDPRQYDDFVDEFDAEQFIPQEARDQLPDSLHDITPTQLRLLVEEHSPYGFLKSLNSTNVNSLRLTNELKDKILTEGLPKYAVGGSVSKRLTKVINRLRQRKLATEDQIKEIEKRVAAGEDPHFAQAQVRGVDTSEPARMKRAAAQGFEGPEYHGSRSDIEGIDPKKFGAGADQSGPGFYTTKSSLEAGNYTTDIRQGENPNIMDLMINDKSHASPESKKISRYQVQRLIEKAPNLDEKLQDWDENPIKAKAYALSTIYNDVDDTRDILENVWATFYRNNEDKFAEATRPWYSGFKNPNFPLHTVTTDPRKVRSKRAMFDPEFSDFKDLMAGAGGLSFLGYDQLENK